MNTGHDYQDVLRRAQLYDCIAEMVHTAHGNAAFDISSMRFSNDLPELTIMDGRVLCNGRSLDLARRPLTLKLFEAFCAAPGYRLERDEVIRIIYGRRASESTSRRYADSLHTNSIKLISRARILATKAFGRCVPPGCEWFVYSQDRRCWQLVRL